MFPLSDLSTGESSVVLRLSPQAKELRLAELGLSPGTRVTCIGRSPLGDPSAYYFLGSVFAIRAKDAAEVFVQGAHE